MAAEQRDSNAGVVKYITLTDLARLMKKHDHFDSLQPNDLNLLMSRFDKDRDGKISINEVSIFQTFTDHSFSFMNKWSPKVKENTIFDY
jgi:Ca2+-binding EF-hand superfamily protein